jgi:hypothetical protein
MESKVNSPVAPARGFPSFLKEVRSASPANGQLETRLARLLELLQMPHSKERDFFSYIPPPMDPWTFNTERLYKFPESDFLPMLMLKDFGEPRPFHPSMMKDIPTDDSPLYKWFLVAMEEQWSRTCSTMFASDWDGLPELFTKKVTKFVAGLRFACPSAYFDKLFQRYWFTGIQTMVTNRRDAMMDQFYEVMRNVFTDLPEDTVRAFANDATSRIQSWVIGEMTEYMYLDTYRDVAMFSWQFWTEVWRFLNTERIPGTPFYTDYRPLSDFFWYAWRESGVRCESGPAVLARYLHTIETIEEFGQMLERIKIEKITGNVMAFMSELAHEYDVDITNFDSAGVIANTIKTYVRYGLEFMDKQKEYFVSNGDGNVQPDMMPLYNAFLQFEDVPGFVWALFSELGYVSGPRPVDAPPLEV